MMNIFLGLVKRIVEVFMDDFSVFGEVFMDDFRLFFRRTWITMMNLMTMFVVKYLLVSQRSLRSALIMCCDLF